MLTVLPCFSPGSSVYLQRTKSNCNTTSTDHKHDRWSQKSTFLLFFTSKCNIQTCESTTPLPCCVDSPQPTLTARLPESIAMTNNTVPTATANQVREISTSVTWHTQCTAAGSRASNYYLHNGTPLFSFAVCWCQKSTPWYYIYRTISGASYRHKQRWRTR